MYSIKIIEYFSAAHSLRNYKGKCEALHGHNWKVEVMVSSAQLNDSGMVLDFSVLKTLTKRVLEDLDHRYLNEVDFFKVVNPSSEEIARYIYTALQKQVNDNRCQIAAVSVWETETSSSTYQER